MGGRDLCPALGSSAFMFTFQNLWTSILMVSVVSLSQILIGNPVYGLEPFLTL